MNNVYFFILYFFVYGFAGWCVEVAFAAWKERHFVNRGFLNGPICPIYGFGVGIVVQFLTPFRDNFLLLYITSVLLVTILEWFTGFILEKVFHNKWWDYSDMPLNLGGYVCLLFSLIWGVACVLIVDFIHPLIHKVLSPIPPILGLIIIIILGIVVFADLYVTVSDILKLNNGLAKMHEIAKELHQISEKLGRNIFSNTISAIEVQEEISDALDIDEHIADLKKHYKQISDSTTHIQRRLVKAFPKMESHKYAKALKELKEKLKNRRN